MTAFACSSDEEQTTLKSPRLCDTFKLFRYGGSVYIVETISSLSVWTHAKSPGIPTANDGFTPHKRWDGKSTVRVPDSKTRGFLARDGSVWVPTGPKPSIAHGGPHWDVQHPDGSHTNVYPGGKERN